MSIEAESPGNAEICKRCDIQSESSRNRAVADSNFGRLLHDLQVHKAELEAQNLELRQAQQELEEARARYADLYDYAPVGYLTLDERGIVQEINLTGAGMLDKERAFIVDKPFITHLAPASIQAFLSHLQRTLSLPGNSVVEVMLADIKGKQRVVNLESLAVAGSKNLCRTVMNDISAQRRMSVALQISRSAQDALLNAIPAIVFFMDTELRYLNVSQMLADFVGVAPEEMIGKTAYDYFTPEIADEFQAVARNIVKTGEAVYGYESTLQDRSGNLLHFSSFIAPFRDYQGCVIGLVGVRLDVTAYKTLLNSNNELLLQNRTLTRNLFTVQEEERRNLARELHDELGQWFTAIQAEAQVIRNAAKHDPEIYQSASAISTSAGKVHEVIRGMLQKLRPSLMDVLGLEDSLRELQRQWSHAHPEVDCIFNFNTSLDGLGEELNINLYRIIQEAMNNVARHSDAKRVEISFDREKGGGDETDSIMLRIWDNGSGFTSINVRAGIGLVGMRERVIALGGEFSLDSNPGVGVHILVSIPLIKTRE